MLQMVVAAACTLHWWMLDNSGGWRWQKSSDVEGKNAVKEVATMEKKKVVNYTLQLWSLIALQNNSTTVIARSGSCDVFSSNDCVKYGTETGSMRLEKCEFEAIDMNIKSFDFKLISKCLVMYVLQTVGTLDSSASMNKCLCLKAATVACCAVMELFQATACQHCSIPEVTNLFTMNSA